MPADAARADGAWRLTDTFNSLFEMPDNFTGYDRLYGGLSILYLRCCYAPLASRCLSNLMRFQFSI